MGFWSDFTGKSARKDLQRGTAAAMDHLDTGAANARSDLSWGYQTARADIDPYIQSGQQGHQMYSDLMGLNGEAPRGAAQALYESDEGFMGQLGESQNAMLRNMNARGLSGSGAGALAGARVARQGYESYLDRVRNMSTQGQQLASQGASMAYGYGNDQANLQYGVAQQKAGLETGQANAMGSQPQHVDEQLAWRGWSGR